MPYTESVENKVRETVMEKLLQELESRTESLLTQVNNLYRQFEMVLMEDTEHSRGRNEESSEIYPAHSPLAKRIDALNKKHQEISDLLKYLGEDFEI